MMYDLKSIRLDKLNIPTETLRKRVNPSSENTLETSLSKHGLMVPLVVTLLGKGPPRWGAEYAVWDGTRRTGAMRRLGWPGSKMISCLVRKGSDADSVVAQININQARERLSDLAEAEGLRQLVEDHGQNQVSAAKILLKSKSWATLVMKTWKLPKKILQDLRKGKFGLTHAMVMAKYMEYPEVMMMLHKEALKNTSVAQLKALGKRAVKSGIKNTLKYRGKEIKFGKKSSIRLVPLQKGMRAEIHLNEVDSKKKALETLKSLFKKLE